MEMMNNEGVDDPLEEVEPRNSSFNGEKSIDKKEIKLKIPIPSFLIPQEFRKKQPSDAYSPITAKILSTPKSIYRKKQQILTVNNPSQICGFLESLDGTTMKNNEIHWKFITFRNFIFREDCSDCVL